MAKQKTAAVWTAAEASGLKESRKALGFSQQGFADIAGIARRRYSWIEYVNSAGECPVRPSKAENAGIIKALSSEPKAPKAAEKIATASKAAGKYHSHDGRKSHPAGQGHRG